jgi:hypothetical protein
MGPKADQYATVAASRENLDSDFAGFGTIFGERDKTGADRNLQCLIS